MKLYNISTKRVITVLLAICMLFALAACKSSRESASEVITEVTSVVPSTASTSTPTTEPPQSTTVVAETEQEQMTYGENGRTEATKAAPKTTYKTTYRTTYRTTQKVVRTTAYNDAGCLDDDALTY